MEIILTNIYDLIDLILKSDPAVYRVMLYDPTGTEIFQSAKTWNKEKKYTSVGAMISQIFKNADKFFGFMKKSFYDKFILQWYFEGVIILAADCPVGFIAILAFTIARTGSDSWLTVVTRVYHPKNFGLLVQVLLEDITIAILFVRFRAVLGLRVTIALVAVLFAAGHIPALLTGGAILSELSSLILDAGLGIAILSVVQRSADIWWFWCVHFAMDMMQFYAAP